MEITPQQVKELRQMTSASIMKCKQALIDAKGDMDKAKEILKKTGQAIADKKSARDTYEGTVAAYVHSNGKVATLLELACETDFVAKNEDFQELAKSLAAQVAGYNPEFVSMDEVSDEERKRIEKEVHEEFKKSGKPADVIKKIATGKIEKTLAERSLLSLPYYKDDSKTVEQVITDAIAKLGENIRVVKFVRYSI